MARTRQGEEVATIILPSVMDWSFLLVSLINNKYYSLEITLKEGRAKPIIGMLAGVHDGWLSIQKSETMRTQIHQNSIRSVRIVIDPEGTEEMIRHAEDRIFQRER